jgi:tetratricopeptide (TPR) repeat protein
MLKKPRISAFITFSLRETASRETAIVDADEKKLYVKLANGYYQNKEYKKAIELYEKLYSADAEDVNILNMLADSYSKTGNSLKALDGYVAALSIYEKKLQYEKVVRIIKKVMKTYPEEPRVKNKLKSALRTMIRDAEKKVMDGEFEEARNIYESIIDFNSEEYPINIKMKELNDAEARHKSIKMKQMENEMKAKTSGTGNELVDKFEIMAQNYLDNGDYDGAVETYITALKLAPNDKGLRDKLHRVYSIVASKSTGEKIWEKLDGSPKDKLEEAKRKAVEERNKIIMQEEEDRARLLLEEEAKMQGEYEKLELEIIQKAAVELKTKLDEAQKNEKLKAEEVQKIMKEQEEKKKALLEKLKREAIDKWNKQKDDIMKKAREGMPEPEIQAASKPLIAKQPEPVPSAAPSFASVPEEPKMIKIKNEPVQQPFKIDDLRKQPVNGEEKKKSLSDALKGAYALPTLAKSALETAREIKNAKEEAPVSAPSVVTASAQPIVEVPVRSSSKFDELIEDNEMESRDDLEVNDDTLDSLITTAFIYINQNLLKEALHIYNKVSEKYSGNPEVQQIAAEVAKRQGK